MIRYAAIDIGSNAVRLLIADINVNEDQPFFKKNTLVRVPLRLGDDAFLNQLISARKAAELKKTMLAFSNLMDVYHVKAYRACATSAIREASNRDALVHEIFEETGLNLEIITGEEEAAIIYANHIESKIPSRSNFLYVDVGGGSTELSLFVDNQIVVSSSFNIGTIRVLDNQDKEEQWEAMRSWIKEHTKLHKNLVAIGTGGNINKLFQLSREKENTPMTATKLNSLYNMLCSYSLKERINILELNPDRADVIVPAAEIYLTMMKWSGIRQIYVPRLGLVDGIINLLMEGHAEELKQE